MTLDTFLTFGVATAVDLMSYTLLLSMAAKVISTGSLLLNTHFYFLKPQVAEWLWWITKLSSLTLCASALMLYKLAQDALGVSVFSALLVATTVFVVWVGFRRIKTVQVSATSAR